MVKNKVALGTAQFGMDYGINNKRGKISRDEAFDILNEALRSGIDILDTAQVYGDSEFVIGEFIKKYKKRFKIVSKLPQCDPQQITSIFETSLKHLGVDTLYGYLFHSFRHYRENPGTWGILENLKSKGRIKKIGFSLYFPEELNYIIKNKLNIDMIQVPYSIFDRRFEPYFPELKDMSVEIHIRSVFLQGLVFKNTDELDVYFTKVKDKLVNLNSLSKQHDIPVVALCLNFAILNRFIDKVVVGVDSMDNLKEIVSSQSQSKIVKNLLTDLYSFKEDDEDMILPVNWKVKTP